jgi:hypothetical protein
MLTIFTIPKPFRGHVGVIQRNAIESWIHLEPRPEIVLCGDDAGVAEAAAEFRVQHLPNVASNEFGTPFLDSAFERVQGMARHRIVCYVNADIIFLPDFIAAVQRITSARFLMVGQRWNLDVTGPIRFEEPDWQRRLRERTLESAELSPPGAIDYFVFPKGVLGELPAFVVGRPGWDNWMLQRAHALRIPVIDTTAVNMIIHQNHGYGHIPQKRGDGRWDGPEADYNLGLGEERGLRYTLLDATHVMTNSAVVPALGYRHLRRRLVRRLTGLPALSKVIRPFARLLDSVLARPQPQR